MTIEESESNCEATDDSSCLLLEEDCVKDESVQLSNLPSGGTVRRRPESDPSTSKQNATRLEERIEVIFEVVAHGDHEALSDLLITDTTSVCAINSKGNTALHHAVASAFRKVDLPVDSFYQCIDVLMNCEQMNINMPNKKGYTAIGLAVHHLNRTCVEHMLKHPSAGRLHLDYYPGDRESTVREIIMETYPDLQPLLPEPLLERLDYSERNTKLLAALQIDKFNIFTKNLDLNNPNPWYDEPYHSSLLEIACQMKNRKTFVELLLHNGAGPNIVNSVTGMPLIHATARSGNFELLELLLRQSKVDASVTDNKNKTILHWLARVSGKNPGDRKRLDRCFKLVLDFCENKIIDWRDDEGNTALYVAVKSEFQDRVLLLLKRGADITLFIHGTPILSSVSTPMLKAILDDCLECKDKPEKSEDLKLTFSYEILNKIVPYMLKCLYERELLKHPFTLCFINLHYVYITFFILSDMLIYSIQLFTLMYAYWYPGHVPFVVLSSMWVAAVICDLFCFWFIHIKILRTFELFLSLPMIIYIVGLNFNVLMNSWIWPHLLLLSILLTGLKLGMITVRLLLVAVRVEMLKKVSFTFLKYMAGYSFVLITLALTIFINLKGSSKEGDIGDLSRSLQSFLKARSMSTCDIEFPNSSFVTLPDISQIIFSLFFLLASFILLKLLNGLVMLDAKELKIGAENLTVVATVRQPIDNNTYRTTQKILGSNEMKEGIYSVYPHSWKAPSPPLLVRFKDSSSFSHCLEIKNSVNL